MTIITDQHAKALTDPLVAGFIGLRCAPRRRRRQRSSAQRLKVRLLTPRPARAPCRWCTKSFAVEALTVDHVVPLAWGGADAAGNAVLACRGCNVRRERIQTALEMVVGLRPLGRGAHLPLTRDARRAIRERQAA